MTQRFFLFVALLLPQWVWAQNSNTYTSPSFLPADQDVSVYLLGKIFGRVGGVLHGDSLIFGELFYIFNLAMLAIASIVLIYIIFVSTLNTCGEGEIMGRKWSSIFIPLRAVGGIALILPLAGGYSAIQIFIMWVTLQGVGLADRLWEQTADFIVRGGQVLTPEIDLSGSSRNGQENLMVLNRTSEQAGQILQRAVCMGYIQEYFRASQEKLCPRDEYKDSVYCRVPAPDFFSSVNFLNAESTGVDGTKFSVHLPTMPKEYALSQLNGICGTIEWQGVSQDKIRQAYAGVEEYVDDSLIEQAALARAVALQQVYLDMSSVARTIVNNGKKPGAEWSPLGEISNDTPRRWVGRDNLAPLFNGDELVKTAVSYNAIMRPTQNLLSGEFDHLKGLAVLFNQAKKQGWIMAGSYFFEVAGVEDKDTKLREDANGFSAGGGDLNPTGGNHQGLSRLIDDGFFTKDMVESISRLIKGWDGDYLGVAAVPYIQEATAFGTGSEKPSELANSDGGLQDSPLAPPSANLPKGKFKGGVFNMVGSMGTLFYNQMLLPIMDMIAQIALVALAPVYMLAKIAMGQWLIKWIEMIGAITGGVVNPIVGIALIGQTLINQAVIMWETIMGTYLALAALPPTVAATFASLAFIGPLVMALFAILFSAGLFLGYYVPLMPYIFFLLGAIAWMIAVIEAMVAAPLVALGIMHPEGHEVFGKAGDSAIPLLFNLFLRPAMMVIGFIGAILLSYAAIQLLQFGFMRVLETILGFGSLTVTGGAGVPGMSTQGQNLATGGGMTTLGMAMGSTGGGLFGLAVLGMAIAGIDIMELLSLGNIIKSLAVLGLYVMVHVIVLEKAFSLIYILPDQVLRWLFSGFRDQMASDTAQMTQKASGMLQGAAGQVASAAIYRTPGIDQLRKKKDEDNTDKNKNKVDAAAKGDNKPSFVPTAASQPQADANSGDSQMD